MTRAASPRGRIPQARRGSPAAERAADWRAETLSLLRRTILQADLGVVEEVKWRKPSNPEGVPVWSHDGILCVGNTLKNAVRLTFAQGARIRDPARMFNTRLDSKTVRAVDFFEGAPVDRRALSGLVREAVRLNTAKVRSR